MSKDITIPPEAVKAAAFAYTSVIYRGNGTTREFHDAIAAASLAMLKAWPGMHTEDHDTPWPPRIILPLPKEARDE